MTTVATAVDAKTIQSERNCPPPPLPGTFQYPLRHSADRRAQYSWLKHDGDTRLGQANHLVRFSHCFRPGTLSPTCNSQSPADSTIHRPATRIIRAWTG